MNVAQAMGDTAAAVTGLSHFKLTTVPLETAQLTCMFAGPAGIATINKGGSTGPLPIEEVVIAVIDDGRSRPV